MTYFDPGFTLPRAYAQIGTGPQLGGVWGDIWGGIKWAGGGLWDIVTSGKFITAAAVAAATALGVPPELASTIAGAVTAYREQEGQPGAVSVQVDGQTFDFTADEAEGIYTASRGGVPSAGIDPMWIVAGIAGVGLIILVARK